MIFLNIAFISRSVFAKMFDRIFFTHGKICEPLVPPPISGGKGIQKHINELKKLMFQPGSPVDVPIIGNRTAIFEPQMRPYYDYALRSRPYKTGQDCYVFEIKVPL